MSLNYSTYTMTRKVTSYRLPEMTLSQLKALTETTGSSDANVIAFAIDRMFQQEIVTMKTELIVSYVASHLTLGDRIHPEQLRLVAARNGLSSYATEWQKQNMSGLTITVEDLAIEPHSGYGFHAAIQQMAAMASHSGLEVIHPQPRSPMLASESVQGDWSYHSYIVYPGVSIPQPVVSE